MARIETRQFGALDYDPGAALKFPAGLPGFEDCSDFILIERPAMTPVVFLQSLETPALCFTAVPVLVVEPGYEIAVTREDLAALELDVSGQPKIGGGEVLCLAILAPENGRWTANLMAPVVMNLRNRVAVQAVREDARYSHAHPLGGPAECS